MPGEQVETLTDRMSRLLSNAAGAAEANQLADASAEASAAIESWKEAGEPDYEETTDAD
jgi:hypothetical protein